VKPSTGKETGKGRQLDYMTRERQTYRQSDTLLTDC